jgi:hypothetical protein
MSASRPTMLNGTWTGRSAFGQNRHSRVPPDLRRVRWAEYAQSRNVPMFAPGRGVGMYSLPGIWTDATDTPPHAGDSMEWKAVFDLLVARSRNGVETRCTAFFDPSWKYEPSTGIERPHIVRGRLGDHH